MELNSVVFYDYLAFGFYMRRGLPNFDSPPDIQYDYEKN